MELEDSLASMQRAVGGLIQAVYEPGGRDAALICNEEGKLLGLPANQLATDMAAVYNDVLVGNAILMGAKGEDFVGLTAEAAKNIVEKWGTGGC